MAHHSLNHSIVTFLAVGTIRIKAIQLFKINPLVFSLLLSCWIPTGSSLIYYNLWIFCLSVYQKITFFSKKQIHERKNRDLLASHFLCEGLTPALSLYTSCHLLSWYSHKVFVKLHICMNISFIRAIYLNGHLFKWPWCLFIVIPGAGMFCN